ncbi:hypothetical protein COEREDRAFT_80285 [Coemansia reversa NRRL 1564]|uniref:Protein kinase domain-containing protein n=1 Tax=Coemansia reversa (strain ATCC 12441 / NRRL 1564) TaxID=763665 RepID=A0A2G5BH00_COERN|nr:hypothetical protein COEREDRAFT_80285 [Coemansia reversa NRRL 1564]|eukprot:PIA17997.1 hypothetical protein COEREDRAFT_80285 [Coemansia reversa NRRL 1564]
MDTQSAMVPKCSYKLTNHQNTPMSQDNYKANGVFLYPRSKYNMSAVHMPVEINVEAVDECIPENAFENIVDYVYAIWNSQPTRTFVPTLYLHDMQLKLLVFTQDKWYEVIIGPLCYSAILDSDFEDILIAMQKYWFIVTLSSHSFGHFCDVNNEIQYLDLIHDSNDWIMAKAHILNTAVDNTSAIEINKRIPHQIYARNRAAYLFDTNHSVYGRIVLKLSWTPVDRLPEGAVYDLLARTDVENIPKIYDCGLLKDNFFGHRLEYMVIEHCGIPIDKHFENIREQEDSSTKAKKEIEWILPQVASCLIQALGHGILHRDISLGNITISRGQVKVIDWGYAKILGTTDLDIDTIATRWHFDKQNVLANETEHDPLTGTWLYMSIQVLFGSRKRDIMDDLESLFYVFLDALWRLYSSPSDNYTSQDSRLGFQFHNKKTLAATRAGILGLKDTYSRFFGFDSRCQSIPEVLNDLYECLFYSDDRYIASILVHDPYYKRTIDKRLALKFLNEAAITALEKHQGLSNRGSVDFSDETNMQARVFYDPAIEDKVANYAAVNDINDTLLTPPSIQ